MLRSFFSSLASAILLAAPLLVRAQTYTVGQTYYGANNYIEYQPGDLPIIISAPHGGKLSVSSSLIPDRANGTYNGVTYNDILTDADTNTQELARAVAAEIFARTGHRPHLIINLLPRIKLDANREIGVAALGNARAEQAWRDYHETFIGAAKAAALATSGNAGVSPFYFYVDLHGHGNTHPDRLELGYNLDDVDLALSDTSLNRAGVLYDTSLRTLPLVRPGVTLATVLRGSRSIGAFMEKLGFASSPSPLVPSPENSNFFQGGYTTRTHTCWTDNLGDHGLQIECHYTGVRDNATNQAAFARALAQALNGFLYDNYGYSLGASSIYTLSTSSTALTAGGAALTVTVNRSGYKSFSDTVAFTFGGTAVRGTDYTASADSVSFTSGQSSRTFTLTPLAGSGAAGDKTITIALAPVVPQTADTTPLTLALAGNSTPVVRVAAPVATVSESNGSATFTLTRTSTTSPLTVNLSWSGTAIARRHYAQPATTVTFPAGQASVAIDVPLVNDGLVDASRQLTLTATSGSGYVVGAASSATVTITDDDRPAGLALWLSRGVSNSRLADESGNARHGAGVPGYSPTSTTWTMGNASGAALAFSGSYQAAFVPRFTVDPSNAFTLSFRFRTNLASSSQYLISYGPRDSAGSLTVYMTNSTTLRTSLINSTGSTSPSDLDTTIPSLTNNTWRLYTLTVDPSGGRRVYIDGVLQKTVSGWTGALSSTELFWLGWRAQATTSSANYFNGALADVRVYQRALSAAEVSALVSTTYTFATWLAEEGLPANTTTSGDADADAWPNALEYALGSNGNAAASVPQITATRGNGTVQFDFARRTDTTDVSLGLQVAPSASGPWTTVASLSPGSSNWNAAANVTASDTAGVVTLLVTDESSPRYWRIRADIGLNNATKDITPPVPLTFTQQPTSQTVTTGNTLTLTAATSGVPAATYQWRKDGNTLPGETSATLSLPNAQPADSGDYSVIATNSGGSVTSNTAHVVVGVLPSILFAPTGESVLVNAELALSVTVTGSAPLSYQWFKDGNPVAGATSATLSLSPAQVAHSGNYSVQVSNPLGTVTTNPVAVSVVNTAVAPAITTPPASQSLYTGQTLTLSVAVTGTLPLTYQWSKDGSPINGATSATYTTAGITLAEAGDYTVTVTNAADTVTSPVATIAVANAVAPAITTQPTSQSALAGTSASFSVVATGAPAPSYQWRKGSTAIPGATTATLTLNNLTSADQGTYNVVVSNTAGTVISGFVVLSIVTPPTINTPPATQSVILGNSVTLVVGASGSGPFTYEWHKDGDAIAGATFSTLLLANVTLAQSGSYTVKITGPGGTVTSPAAIVTVEKVPAVVVLSGTTVAYDGSPKSIGVSVTPANLAFSVTYDGSPTPPSQAGVYAVVATVDDATYAGSATGTFTISTPATITGQPQSRTTFTGDPVSLSVTATGSPAPSYQWIKDDIPIPGATLATYALDSATVADAGVYKVYVSNSTASATSDVAILTIYPSNYLSNVSVRAAMTQGQTLIMGFVVANGSKPILVRAAGPMLDQFGLAGLPDPRLTLYNASGATVAQNDDWSATLTAVINELGATPFVLDSKDAALLETLTGPHTAHAAGTGSGAVLVEAYDAGTNTGPTLSNVSARYHVGTGNDILIAGFVIAGSGKKQVLIRALGPALVPYGVTGALADPRLAVFDGGTSIASNDDWDSSLSPTFTRLGAGDLDSNSKDAALLIELDTGRPYTVQVSGVNNTTGEALVEIYDADP